MPRPPLAPLVAAAFALAGLSACIVVKRDFDSDWSFDSSWEHVAKTESGDFAIEKGDRLVVGGASGDVTVKATSGVAPHWTAEITGFGETIADAEKVRDSVRIETERAGREVFVRVIGEPVDFGNDHVKMTIGAQVAFSLIVPEGVALELRTAGGDIKATGPFEGDCDLASSYGDVELKNAAGRVTAHSASGRVRLESVRGPLAEARSSYGDLEIADVHAERIVAKTSSGEVTLSDSIGAIEIGSGYGDVGIERSKGRLTGTSSSGDFTVRGLVAEDGGPTTVALESGYGEVRLSGVFTALDVESSSGDVEVEALPGSRVEGSWRMRSGYGKVEIALPADAACALDARTGYGEIACDFPVTSTGGRANDEKSLRGRIGEPRAGASLRLESASGDVQLRRIPISD